MAFEGISVRKILDILRLRLELGQSERVIARSVNCARSTVGAYMARARELGLDNWEKVSVLTEGELDALLFKQTTNVFGTSCPTRSKRPLPDWNKIHLELKRVGVTVELLWQEYREALQEEIIARHAPRPQGRRKILCRLLW
jgi:transposase